MSYFGTLFNRFEVEIGAGDWQAVELDCGFQVRDDTLVSHFNNHLIVGAKWLVRIESELEGPRVQGGFFVFTYKIKRVRNLK